jgi:glycosyltransferase-like protein
LRIALLMHSVLPRGGVVHTLELADALTERGHAVTVIAPAEPGQTLFRSTRASLVLLPMPSCSGSLVSQVRQRIEHLVRLLPAALRAGHFDLLHAHDSLNSNALASLSAIGKRLPPWVRTVHHLDDFTAPELRDWQQRGWMAAAAVGCVSEHWCQHFNTALGVPAARLFNGVNLQRFSASGPAMQGAPYVLALGGVEARKNSVRLLQAFAQAKSIDPSWQRMRLVIAGGASLLDHSRALADWQAALAELGLREGAGQPVERLGPLPDAALPAWMRGAALLATPSLMEGFGLVALEALACGTPVLASARAPFTEHLDGCEHVAWCDPEDVASIAAGLLQAAQLPRGFAPPAVCLDHSWARSAAVHAAWYAQVLHDQAVPA